MKQQQQRMELGGQLGSPCTYFFGRGQIKSLGLGRTELSRPACSCWP